MSDMLRYDLESSNSGQQPVVGSAEYEMNFWFQRGESNFLTNLAAVILSRGSLLHDFTYF